MNTYFVFLIQAYEQKMENGTLIDNVTIELIDTTVESAMKRAEALIKKPFYRCVDIYEKPVCSSPQQ